MRSIKRKLNLLLLSMFLLPLQAFSAEASIGVATADQLEEAKAQLGLDWPIHAEAWPTTAGEIYMANVDSQISALERRIEARFDPLSLAQLGLLYYHRFQIVGNLADAETALDLLQRPVGTSRPAPLDIALARVLIGFHDFENAAMTLNRAAESGRAGAEIESLRQSMERATGGSNNLGVLSNRLTPVELVSRADTLARNGDLVAATQTLKLAQDRYTDTSPYILAWIHVQQGILFLQNDDYQAARRFFLAAHQRFPQYTLATEHLAEVELALGNIDSAATLYRMVLGSNTHPEFVYQLSRAESLLGNDESSEQLAAEAAQGFETLVEKYPLMYADHATHYFIATRQRDKALALALANYEQWQTPQAAALLTTARECCR